MNGTEGCSPPRIEADIIRNSISVCCCENYWNVPLIIELITYDPTVMTSSPQVYPIIIRVIESAALDKHVITVG